MDDVDKKLILTTEEVSYLTTVSVGTLNNWRSKKIGPPYRKIGKRKIGYMRADIEAWIQRNPILTKDSIDTDLK